MMPSLAIYDGYIENIKRYKCNAKSKQKNPTSSTQIIPRPQTTIEVYGSQLLFKCHIKPSSTSGCVLVKSSDVIFV